MQHIAFSGICANRNLADADTSSATVMLLLVDGPRWEQHMPDLRTILRSFTPGHALRNARRDVVEHERVVAEIDAIVQRLPAARTTLGAPDDPDSDLMDVVEERPAS
jgi:hypothetical protein